MRDEKERLARSYSKSSDGSLSKAFLVQVGVHQESRLLLLLLFAILVFVII